VSVEFLITSLVVVVSPGTGVLYTLATALSRGSRASLIAAIGCTLGILPQMVAAIFGLAALLNASAAAFQTVKYAGVAYLIYLAWNALRERGALAVDREIGARSAAKLIATAILINLLNPKLTLFFFAFLPQFVSVHEAHPITHMLLLSLVFMLLTVVVFAVYGLLAAMAREQIVSRPRVMTWMRRTFAGAFVALAAKLAFAQR
jgi:threonine/homoserine/homoserine lactone efflux protein